MKKKHINHKKDYITKSFIVTRIDYHTTEKIFFFSYIGTKAYIYAFKNRIWLTQIRRRLIKKIIQPGKSQMCKQYYFV